MQIRRSDLKRIVVAIDPAATANEESDDTGIICVARGPHQPETCKLPFCPGHGYVLEDATCHELPTEWARKAIAVYDRWMADRIVAEVNNGGDMVGTVINAVRAGVPYSAVTASRGKTTRAEPVSALYEQGRVHHLGTFPELEEQMETWSPDEKNWSPDRLDALVWGLTALGLIGGQGAAFMAMMQEELATREPEPPKELALIPKPASNLPAELRPGCKHRFQRWPQGEQCVNCGGWR